MAPQLAGQVPVARLGPLVTPLRSVANVCNQENRPRPHLSVNGPRNGVEIYLLQVQSAAAPVAAPSFRASTPLTQTARTRLRADWASRDDFRPCAADSVSRKADIQITL